MSTSLAYFQTIPWAANLINDPAWEPIDTSTRHPKPTTEDEFFAKTLNTERTVRRVLTLRPRAAKDEDVEVNHVRTILELGPGVNGHPNLAHGGFVATVLDEILGLLVAYKLMSEQEGKRKMGWEVRNVPIFTAYLKTNYKKPVPTPSVVLCTAQFDKREGKKIFVSGTVEDGEGAVYATAEALFIEARPKI